MPKIIDSVEVAKAGATFETKAWLGRNRRTRRLTVLESCKGTGGQWYCITHDMAFRNNIGKDGHIETGRHTLCWICFEHGPEVP